MVTDGLRQEESALALKGTPVRAFIYDLIETYNLRGEGWITRCLHALNVEKTWVAF